jgi:hypothetical protein
VSLVTSRLSGTRNVNCGWQKKSNLNLVIGTEGKGYLDLVVFVSSSGDERDLSKCT